MSERTCETESHVRAKRDAACRTAMRVSSVRNKDSDGVERGVEATVGGVVFVQEFGRGRNWFDAGGDVDDGVAGLVYGRKVPSADGGKDGGAVGWAFFGGGQVDVRFVTLGFNF